MPDLLPWITAYHRSTTGKTFNQAYRDYIAEFRGDAALLQIARETYARLVGLDNALAGNLVHRDHIQYVQMVSLGKMLATYDEVLKHAARSSAGERTADDQEAG